MDLLLHGLRERREIIGRAGKRGGLYGDSSPARRVTASARVTFVTLSSAFTSSRKMRGSIPARAGSPRPDEPAFRASLFQPDLEQHGLVELLRGEELALGAPPAELAVGDVDE